MSNLSASADSPLTTLSPALDALAPRLSDSDPAVRRVAVLQLADLGDEAGVPLLLHRLQSDPAPSVRAEAARTLASWESEDVARALALALADIDREVAEAAAQALSELKEPASGNTLLPWVTHDDPFVRASAWRGLRELRYALGFDAAMTALSDTAAPVRREAVTVLGWLKRSEALPALARVAVDDADAEVRRAAAGALGLAADVSARDALLTALCDSAWQVREEAAQTLGKLKFPEAVPPLVDALEDAYWQVRLQAARALGRIGDRRALAPLTVQLGHAISNLRKESALSLGSLRNPEALPALSAAVNDVDPEVRKAVRIALAQIGHPYGGA
ncbi:HEAT repeat domain-containing protein [Cupriavidus sp. AcVe19-6a]|uniref:HEAT repeat domain-containing protein n=1 Tax=Cupriavidus sp. AcVe19-6a TaxID=2821358 RepID=UPI001AE4D578|nr:HEAT repeat domain-containing protein [Cupriavidus sp. AcVe19-6a]MBP0639114.1 HEAT repeat domain-containing protein [Cupriavidus sp. AcVe19-6a]